jgi:hypothetical protein
MFTASKCAGPVYRQSRLAQVDWSDPPRISAPYMPSCLSKVAGVSQKARVLALIGVLSSLAREEGEGGVRCIVMEVWNGSPCRLLWQPAAGNLHYKPYRLSSHCIYCQQHILFNETFHIQIPIEAMFSCAVGNNCCVMLLCPHPYVQR